MSDYIKREDAISWNPERKDSREYSTSNLDDAYETGYEYKIKQLERIPAADMWSPVTERIPEKSGAYLVWAQFPFEEYPAIYIVNFDVGVGAFGYWHESFDSETLGSLGGDFETIDVRYWMPLPNPPKENET